MSKTHVASAVRIEAFGRMESGAIDAATGSFDLASAIARDSRGGKAQAAADSKEAGRPIPHGAYQRRERLGLLVNANAVMIPARPEPGSDDEAYQAWEAEVAIAATLHNATMKDGVSAAAIRNLAREESDQYHLPSEMRRMILGLVEKDSDEFDLAKAIERLAKQVDATSTKAGTSHGDVITKITKALAEQA